MQDSRTKYYTGMCCSHLLSQSRHTPSNFTKPSFNSALLSTQLNIMTTRNSRSTLTSIHFSSIGLRMSSEHMMPGLFNPTFTLSTHEYKNPTNNVSLTTHQKHHTWMDHDSQNLTFKNGLNQQNPINYPDSTQHVNTDFTPPYTQFSMQEHSTLITTSVNTLDMTVNQRIQKSIVKNIYEQGWPCVCSLAHTLPRWVCCLSLSSSCVLCCCCRRCV